MWSAGPSWRVRTEVGPCKPMMLTWVTFYISSREPPPFWKNSSDIKIFGISEFWESWTQSKNDDFWQKKSKIFSENSDQIFEKKTFLIWTQSLRVQVTIVLLPKKFTQKNFEKFHQIFVIYFWWTFIALRILYTSDINRIKTLWPIPKNLCWPIRIEIFIRLGRIRWNTAGD